MKKLILVPVVALCVSSLMAFTVYKRVIMPAISIIEIKPKPIHIFDPIPITTVKVNKVITFSQNEFLDAIGHRESSNRYDIVNKYGYMGKYQFGPKTLRWLGYNLSKEEFLSNPSIQEEAMIKLMKKNKKSLSRHIEKYDGKTIHGVFITESGLIAAAHLVGAGGVRKFLRNGRVSKDGFGTTTVDYILKFNGYKLVY
tara:strand:+ start:1776 stop:2369 length:594 start_codon:yes stop_codon:yes gene_type:complete